MLHNSEDKEELAYKELGFFLVSFESAIYSIREDIAFILRDNGLEDKNYSDIMLSKLTAEPLLSIFQAMLPYHFEDEKKDFVNSLINEFRYVVEIRNIIIHCYWIITAGLFDDNVSLIGVKQKASKSGINHLNLNLEVGEITKLNIEMHKFVELCSGLRNRMSRSNKNYDSFSEDLKNINFKPFLTHFNQIS